MATADQVAELRGMINQPDNVEPWTDAELMDRIDGADSLQALAATIWAEKAATYSELVDVQEGSSRRSLGSLQKNALELAAYYRALASGGVASRLARTRQIERP